MQNEFYNNLKKAHEMLEKASKLVDQSNKFVPRDFDGFDRGNYVRKAGYTLSYIFEMQSDIFDLAPDLTPAFLRPSLKPHDMSIYLEHLESEEVSLRENSIRAFSLYMPKEIVNRFTKEDSLSGKYKIAEAWWNDQHRPFIPLHRLARFFNHENLYIRYHAAKEVEKMYGVFLWNDQENALDSNAVYKWLESENINI